MTIQPRSFAGAAAGLVAGVLLMSFSGFGGLLARDNVQEANAVLACAPSERMLTRQIVQNGQLQTIAECVPAASVQTAAIRNAAVAPRATSVRRASAGTVAQEPEGSERSWKKSALIIGGSAGAGAGIGGAIKGGKGALIGAAIGGGAAAIYEAIKRKD